MTLRYSSTIPIFAMNYYQIRLNAMASFKVSGICRELSSAIASIYRPRNKDYTRMYNELMRPRTFRDDKHMLMADKRNIARDMRRAIGRIQKEHIIVVAED